jgi:cellulose synthase/poly-beta-1,6-N-acetylglucosamine synthase-like glycosyltransferase
MIYVYFAISAVAVVVTVWLWLPTISECWAVLRRRTAVTGVPNESFPLLLFLIPAHDEETLIATCVRSIMSVDYPRDRMQVVVVADNCTDRTAGLARSEGAECLERRDPLLIGKPQALAWGIKSLLGSQWDACVIIDADTVVDANFAKALAARGPLNSVVVQGYFATLNENESWLTRLAGVLARCRYELAYPLRAKAGLNCPLTGNGMCIGRDLLSVSGWQAFSLTENWELYASYTAAGVRIHYAQDAVLYSLEVSTLKQGYSQRRRWLAGRLLVAHKWVAQLASSKAISLHQKVDIIAELTALPPVLHLTLAMLVGIAGLLVTPAPYGALIGILALTSVGSLAAQAAISIARHPDPRATIMAFVFLPCYVVWRLVTAGRTLLTLDDHTWRKTARA